MLQRNSQHTRDHKRKILNLRNLRLRYPLQVPHSHFRSTRPKHYHHFHQRRTDQRATALAPHDMVNTNSNLGRVGAAFEVEEAIRTVGYVNPKTGRSLNTQSRIARHGFW